MTAYHLFTLTTEGSPNEPQTAELLQDSEDSTSNTKQA